MAQFGSEAAHEEHVRELAGKAAELVLRGPKKYPKLDAATIDGMVSQGSVCYLTLGADRAQVYAHDGQVHAIVTVAAQGGYRRLYKKVSGADAAEVLGQLKS